MPLAAQTTVNPQSFSEIICDRITGGHRQNCVVLFEGKMGMGKSVATLRLAYDCSLILARDLGGKPEDYFTFKNIGILTGEETLRITKSIKKHNIYILDDIGAEGMSARGWQSDQNKIMTKLMQTFRTQENVLLMSSPDKEFVDKIARTLIHFKVTMVATYYNQGVSLGKLSMVRKIYTKDGSPNLYPFLRAKGIVYNYIKFCLPPKLLLDKYNDRREKLERDMNLKTQAEMELKRQLNELKEEEKRLKLIDKIAELSNSDGTRKTPQQIAEDKANQNEVERTQRRQAATIYKDCIKGGLSTEDARMEACKQTGVTVSARTLRDDYKKYNS